MPLRNNLIAPNGQSIASESLPLWKRLGIKEHSIMLFLWAPEEVIRKILNGCKEDAYHTEPGFGFTYDYIHSFITSRYALEMMMPQILGVLDFHGNFWFSVPNDPSKVPDNMTRKEVREFCARNGLVEKKTIKLDDDWSAILFKKDPTKKRAFKESREVLRFGL